MHRANIVELSRRANQRTHSVNRTGRDFSATLNVQRWTVYYQKAGANFWRIGVYTPRASSGKCRGKCQFPLFTLVELVSLINDRPRMKLGAKRQLLLLRRNMELRRMFRLLVQRGKGAALPNRIKDKVNEAVTKYVWKLE